MSVLPPLTFTAWGRPVGQGNHRTTRTGRTYETTRGHAGWRTNVTSEAEGAVTAYNTTAGRAEPWPKMGLDCPVAVGLRFHVPRPRSHYGTGRNHDQLLPSAPRYPITNSAGDTAKADIDKQVRAILDALTVARVIYDDARVVKLVVEQVYALTPALVRAIVTVREHDPQPTLELR